MTKTKIPLIEGNTNLKELVWKAFYTNGDVLNQKNADGSLNRYEDIDRSRLSHFGLYEGERPVFVVYLKPGQRLIFRRRVWARTDGSTWHFIYLVGWQMTINNQNIKSIAYVNPSGQVELDDDRNDLQLIKEES